MDHLPPLVWPELAKPLARARVIVLLVAVALRLTRFAVTRLRERLVGPTPDTGEAKRVGTVLRVLHSGAVAIVVVLRRARDSRRDGGEPRTAPRGGGHRGPGDRLRRPDSHQGPHQRPVPAPKKAFDARGIEIPFPHQTLYFGVPKDGSPQSLRVTVDAAAR